MNENRERINESIIRDMSEGVMTINMGGVIDSINPAAERILGKTKDEVLGKKYIRVFMKDKANDVFNQAVLDAMYDPDSKHEKIVSWNNGSQTKQLYMVTSMLFHENQKMGTIIVFGDITELSELKLRYAQDIEKLLHSLVKALSIAIDERSHYTGNHTRNMVDMAEAFLDWMEANGNPWNYDDSQRSEFIMSVGLHDIGKLTVPLEIMDKATRLGPRIEVIKERFIKIKLLYKIAMLEGRISEEEYLKKVDAADDEYTFIVHVNMIGYLPDADLLKVRCLSSETFVDENGKNQRLLTDDEIAMLSIRKGTLTAEERSIMQGHASSTWNILNQVSFPVEYKDVPRWAAAHHEFLQGGGYPNGILGSEIPKEVRLLTILDIFEALTAKDRPYKPSIPIEKAWKILDSMVKEGSLDGELLEAFKKSHAWERDNNT